MKQHVTYLVYPAIFFLLLFFSAGCAKESSFQATQEAMKSIRDENDTKAMEEINIALKKYDKNSLAQSVKAYLLAKSGNNSEATILISKAVNADQYNPEIRLNSAKVFYYDHDYSRAAQEAKRSAELAGNNIEALSFLAYMEYKQGHLDKSISMLKESIEKNKNSPIPLITLGKIFTQKKNKNEALRCYNQALQQFPENTEALSCKTALMLKDNKTDELEKEIQARMKTSPENAGLHLAMAQILLAKNKKEEADKELEKAISLDKSSTHAFTLSGIRKLEKGDAKGSQEDLSRATDLDPSNAEAYLYLSHLQFALENEKGGVEYLEKALLADPQYAPAHARKSELLLLSGKLEDSLAELKKGEKSDPQDALVQLYLARIYIIKRNAKQADIHIEKALQKEPQNFMNLYYKASILAMQKKKDESFAYLSQAIKNGFKDNKKLEQDFCWIPYKNDPDFLKLKNNMMR